MKSLLLSASFLLISSIAVFAAFPVTNHQPVTEKANTTAVSNNTATAVKTEAASETTSRITASKAHATSKAHGKSGGGKSQLVALLLCIFLGGLGIHRFYLGYTWQGVVQLLTAGGCGIWWLIDLIRIITGDLQPKDGSYSETI